MDCDIFKLKELGKKIREIAELPDQQEKIKQWTALNDKKMVIGAMADSVHDVIAFDEDNILDVPELGFNYNAEFILGMLKNKESFTMILDIDKVFSAEEFQIISNTSAENLEIEEPGRLE